jgi:elongation of very long chain fatty acids protein 4
VGVLTEAQVLEDYTHLATHLRTNLSAWDSPLVAVGGSLAGEMSTWWRIRYPFIVDMALAGSAPIFGFPGPASNGAPLCDEFSWQRVATDAFRTVGGEACVDAFRSGYWQTAGLSPAAVTAAFNTCTPATLPCHAQQVAAQALYWTGTAAELGSYPPHANRSLLEWSCGVMAGKGGLDAYIALMQPLLPGQCLNISWAESCDGGDAAMPALVWLFAASKVVDFADTALIVARAKWAQLSFLHCYHHATIFVMFWLVLLAGAQGDVFFTVLINSTVHALMYLYYLLASLGVRPAWGRYLTQFQIVQFVLMNTQALLIFAGGCAYPTRMNALYLVYCASLLFLFAGFYVEKHCWRRRGAGEDGLPPRKQRGAADKSD